MAKFTLSIDLGNDAMQTAGEVIDSLRRSLVKGAPLFDPFTPGESGVVMDGNGNSVGEWRVTD